MLDDVRTESEREPLPRLNTTPAARDTSVCRGEH